MLCAGCVVVLVPYPNNQNPVELFNVKTDFDLKGDGLVWYARPQLFFNCTLCPTGAKEPRPTRRCFSWTSARLSP